MQKCYHHHFVTSFSFFQKLFSFNRAIEYKTERKKTFLKVKKSNHFAVLHAITLMIRFFFVYTSKVVLTCLYLCLTQLSKKQERKKVFLVNTIGYIMSHFNQSNSFTAAKELLRARNNIKAYLHEFIIPHGIVTQLFWCFFSTSFFSCVVYVCMCDVWCKQQKYQTPVSQLLDAVEFPRTFFLCVFWIKCFEN